MADPEHSLSPLSDTSFDKYHDAYGYGSLIDEDITILQGDAHEDTSTYIRGNISNRRWSILDKLERRHYCSVRSCNDCMRILNFRCLLATTMLGICIVLAMAFTKTLLSPSPYDYSENMYDFIVIGGGPSGSVITKQLHANGAKVLLLEAGFATQYDVGGKDYFGGPVTRFDIPFLWSSVSHFPQYHWEGFNFHGVLIAKGLGGCGIHNAMVYIRAVANDICKWNIRTISWSLLLKKYISLEKYDNSNINSEGEKNPYFHGTDGPFTTSAPSYIDQIAPQFISSAIHAGLKFVSDFNNPDSREGVGYYHFNIKGGIRDSAAREMLGPLLASDAASIGNVYDTDSKAQIVLGATVRKIILNPTHHENYPLSNSSSYGTDRGDTNEYSSSLPTSAPTVSTTLYKAIGVEYEQDGVIKYAYLNNIININQKSIFEGERNIILTAGAIMTPKILMNSGIGPSDVLRKNNIDVKLPIKNVGKHLQDHPAVGVTVLLDSNIAASYPSAYTLSNQWSEYIDSISSKNSGNNFGMLGSTGVSAGGFLISPYATDNQPDIQLTVYPTVSEPHLTQTPWNINATSPEVLLANNQMLITVSLLYPEGRLSVELNNTDPINTVPIIKYSTPEYHNLHTMGTENDEYLTNNDVSRLVWGVEMVRTIVSTPPLSQLTTKEISPGLSEDGASLREWVRNNYYPSSHWAGTARMGYSEDDVVDDEMKVKRVKGLRIADASIIPLIPSGNIHTTVIALASLCVDFIMDEVNSKILN